VALTLTSFFELSAKKGPFSLYGSFKGVFEGAARYWPNGHQALKAGVQELYLSYDQEVVDLWFGRKIHRWGAADGYNPMDLFNPLDSSDPIASGRFLNRVPKWLGGVNLALGPINIEAVYLPRPEVVALPEPGEPWEPRSYRELRRARDQGLLTLTRRSPTRRWNQKGEVGLKLATVLAGWDLAAMAYRGYFDEPLFRVGLSPFGLMASGEYVNFRAYGLSFAKGVGAATIRGEAVVKPDYPVQGPLNWSRGRLIQTVLGWDRDFDGFFYLNLQVFLEFQNKTASKAKEDRQGLTYEASFKWSLDEWAAGARGQIYLTGEGALNELFLEWRFDDHWKFSLGTMVFSGAKTGLLGQYRDNDNAYITLRYSF
jgi:hypothetical protein